MLNPFREVNWRPDRKERRRFAASLILGFPVVTAILLVAGAWGRVGWKSGSPLVLGGAGVVLGLILWVVPAIVRPFYVGWYAVACSIGFVIGNGALAAVYFLVLTPVGLVLRVIRRNAFSKGFDRTRPSYWCDAPPPAEAERYYRQF